MKNTQFREVHDKKFNCSKDQNLLFYSFNRDSKKTILKTKTNKSSLLNPLLDGSKPEFIKTIDKNKYIVKSGTWDIKKPIFIEGEVEINQGTILRFSNNSYMAIKGIYKLMVIIKNLFR